MVRAQGRSKPDRSWYPEDFDWYLKWVASIVILCSLAMRAAGPEYRMLDIYFGWVPEFHDETCEDFPIRFLKGPVLNVWQFIVNF